MNPGLLFLAGVTAGSLLTWGLTTGYMHLGHRFWQLALEETQHYDRAWKRPVVWIEQKSPRVRSGASVGVSVKV